MASWGRRAPSERNARSGPASVFSTVSAFSRPRIPALWIASARTAGHAVGPRIATSRNAHTYSGRARSRINRSRVTTTAVAQADTDHRLGVRPPGTNGSGVAKLRAAGKARMRLNPAASTIASNEIASVDRIAA